MQTRSLDLTHLLGASSFAGLLLPSRDDAENVLGCVDTTRVTINVLFLGSGHLWNSSALSGTVQHRLVQRTCSSTSSSSTGWPRISLPTSFSVLATKLASESEELSRNLLFDGVFVVLVHEAHDSVLESSLD